MCLLFLRSTATGPRFQVHYLSVEEITGKGERGEPSAVIMERVVKAQQLQLARYRDETFNYNSELRGKALKKYCRLDQASLVLLKGTIDSLGLSARAYYRILRLARTIADLEWLAENPPTGVIFAESIELALNFIIKLSSEYIS